MNSCAYQTGMDLQEWQKSARECLIDLLGIRARLSNPRCSLDPQTVWERRNEYGSITKMTLQMEPGFRNQIYICIPDNVKPPYQAFLCIQGHTTGMHQSIAVDYDTESVPYSDVPDDDFAIGCMKRGIPAVCLEQRAMGVNSTNADHYPSCYIPVMQALLKGETLLAQRIFDVDRVIDYISSRGDFDISKLGIMGNSGGGTTTMFSGALLPRLTHIMPSCSFCTFKDSIHDLNHCSCNHIPKLMVYGESADVVGLIAPKPLVVVNGEKDTIFPIGAAKAQFKRLKDMYESVGAGEKCTHVIGPEGHRFYAEQAWKVMLKYWFE